MAGLEKLFFLLRRNLCIFQKIILFNKYFCNNFYEKLLQFRLRMAVLAPRKAPRRRDKNNFSKSVRIKNIFV